MVYWLLLPNYFQFKGCGLFAPLLGGYDIKRRKDWATGLDNDDISGYFLLGLHNNGPGVQEINVDKYSDVIKSSLVSIYFYE